MIFFVVQDQEGSGWKPLLIYDLLFLPIESTVS